MPEECLLFPAHDYRGLTATSVAEEKLFNPRIGGARSEQDFVGYMANLGLPHPKQMDAAVPANLECGFIAAAATALEASWAPLRYTYSGIDELDAEWVAEHRRELQIVDVREPHEYTGELGHIAGAKLIPLGSLAAQANALDRSAATVTVCRSGGRSAQAVTILARAGFGKVANLAGGMLEWRTRSLPTQ